MPDLLTHALVGYLLGVAAVRADRLPDRYVPVLMVGAVVPDGMKSFVVAGVDVGVLFGVPYSAWGIHTLGGVAVLAGLGALTIHRPNRRLGYVALLAGSVSHLLLDTFVIRVDGVAPPYLFPLTGWLPPSGNLYASSDVWPAVVVLAFAVPVWLVRRRDVG
jgi:membrane-bound metal-dependent hydrolase YbcI (DUF457 family)